MKEITTLLKNKNRLAVWGGILLAGIVLGHWMKGGEAGPVRQDANAALALQVTDEELKVYVCPMACVAPMKEPGNCPVCGMALVPTPAAEGSGCPDIPRGRGNQRDSNSSSGTKIRAGGSEALRPDRL
jgi:hypothetical protein